MLTVVDLKVRIIYIGKTKLKNLLKIAYSRLDNKISNEVVLLL